MFYVFPRIISDDICDAIIKDCKSNPYNKGLIIRDGEEDNNPNIRKTLIHFIKNKDNEVNKLAWHFLREANKLHFHYDLEYFQVAQFSEYSDGGFYDWHQDTVAEEAGSCRKLSLTLQLSDPDTFEGGELEFFSGERGFDDMEGIEGKQVEKDITARGSVIVFDSRDWHRVRPVKSGIRYSAVCWCVGANFK